MYYCDKNKELELFHAHIEGVFTVKPESGLKEDY